MGETHRVEIEIDDRRFRAIQSEAERLGVDVPQVLQRAMAAWLSDIGESAVATSADAR